MLNGIFSAISTDFSCLERHTYSKPSMLAISHALEDVVISFELYCDMFATFQRFEFFLLEKARYLELEKCCRKVFVFARHIDRSRITEFTNTIFIEIEPNSSLADEWAVVVNHPQHPILLTTTEQYSLQTHDEDDFRYFQGFLSFDPAVVKLAVNQIVAGLKLIGISYEPCPVSVTALTQSEAGINRKISLFINRLLDKLEVKTNQLLGKNILLQDALQANKLLTVEMVQRMCIAAEHRDPDACGHLANISHYSASLYALAGASPEEVENIRYASMMHDIGKIGIPDAILRKPDKLTPAEFEVMKTHTTIGSQILLDSPSKLIQMGSVIAQSHHEQWNGCGYPHGLCRHDIPLVARIVAIVDGFDALSSQRIYKDALPIEICLATIRADRNKKYDGELADLFLENFDSIYRTRSVICSDPLPGSRR